MADPYARVAKLCDPDGGREIPEHPWRILWRDEPWCVGTDGHCALLVRGESNAPPWPRSKTDPLLRRPQRSVPVWLDDLRWLGGERYMPRPQVLPCPEWAEHEAFARGERGAHEWGECYYGCQYEPGLGYAYEDRGFPARTIVAVGNVWLDARYLAEVCAEWPDVLVRVGFDRHADLIIDGDGWRAVVAPLSRAICESHGEAPARKLALDVEAPHSTVDRVTL